MKANVEEKKETAMREVKYVCSKCGAEDLGKFYPGENVPLCLNCHTCRAGYGMPVQTMMSTRTGMFQVPSA